MTQAASSPFRVALYRAQGCYFARVLELPGCVGKGSTEVEAVESARNAIRLHLLIARVLAEDRPRVEVEIKP